MATGRKFTGQTVEPRTGIVISPAGDRIEILSDADWMALTDTDTNSIKQTNGKLPLIAALWNHGIVTDPNGRATKTLWDRAQQYGYKGQPVAINGVMGNDVMRPAVERIINGKRTMSIRLVALPERWFVPLDAAHPHRNGNDAAVAIADARPPAPAAEDDGQTFALPPSPVIEPPAPSQAAIRREVARERHPATVTQPAPEPTAEGESVSESASAYLWMRDDVILSVKEAMLTDLFSIIASRDATGLLHQLLQSTGKATEETQRLLAQRLDENARMRTRLQQAGDQIGALQAEVDGLRQRAQRAERNLDAALRGDAAAAIDARVKDKIAEFMREKPKAKESH